MTEDQQVSETPSRHRRFPDTSVKKISSVCVCVLNSHQTMSDSKTTVISPIETSWGFDMIIVVLMLLAFGMAIGGYFVAKQLDYDPITGVVIGALLVLPISLVALFYYRGSSAEAKRLAYNETVERALTQQFGGYTPKREESLTSWNKRNPIENRMTREGRTLRRGL